MAAALRSTLDNFGGGRILTGSADVIINNQGVARRGDKVERHGKKVHAVTSTIEDGNDTVIVNNQPMARVGSKSSCGHLAEAGSGDVEVG